MSIIHFLDVGNGDCSIIQHQSGRITMIDVCKARAQPSTNSLGAFVRDNRGEVSINAGMFGIPAALDTVAAPTNPIAYLQKIAVSHIHRFVLTHPDMDHMDGIEDLFDHVAVFNMWDTANTKTFTPSLMYRDDDWQFYLSLRNGLVTDTKRLVLYDGARGSFWNELGPMGEPHDGLHILAPTPELTRLSNRTEDWNDGSYVILHTTPAGRILCWGDAHDETRAHVIDRYADLIRGVEIMVAPHHGRCSGGDRKYLDVVRPKLTLFGRAPSEHLAYRAWRNRNLDYITNTQAGNVIIDMSGDGANIYVQREGFARRRNPFTFYSPVHDGHFLGTIHRG